MTLIRSLQRLYSLDTLDTRLTTSSNTPIKAAVGSARDPLAGKDGRALDIAAAAQPSKWNTVEFYFYYVAFVVMVPLMFKTVMDVSQGECSMACQK